MTETGTLFRNGDILPLAVKERMNVPDLRAGSKRGGIPPPR
jgi:hypothetical protein